jgi:hypothetical protein
VLKNFVRSEFLFSLFRVPSFHPCPEEAGPSPFLLSFQLSLGSTVPPSRFPLCVDFSLFDLPPPRFLTRRCFLRPEQILAVTFQCAPACVWAHRSGSFTRPCFLPPLVQVPCSQLLAAPDLCSDFRVSRFVRPSSGVSLVR